MVIEEEWGKILENDFENKISTHNEKNGEKQ